MRLSLLLTLALATFALAGCGGSAPEAERSAELPPSGNAATQSQPSADVRTAVGGGGGGAQTTVQDVSLQQADASQAQPVPAERKIIRDATLTLEVEEPVKASERITSIAESRGGFVVSSESRHVSGARGKAYEVFTVQLRVPAAQFDAALKEIRATAGEVTSEKVSGKDVTEEYIDLEARLRTQRALEAQLLDIMKTANSVSDAISVQRELTNVRTDIERIEGRRRFLESQSTLSTISVTLQPPAPLLATRGFFHGVAEAFGQGVDVAVAITLFLIKAALALLPVFVFIVLPAYLILRYLIRRLGRRTQPTHASASPPPAPPQSPYDDGPQPAV